MARYGQGFKHRAVARLLPPESADVKVVAAEVKDDQVKSFATAQLRVTEISQKWQGQLTGQETEAELQAVQEKARKEMVIAVQNSGLSLQEYNQIAMAAQNDNDLQDRIRAEMGGG